MANPRLGEITADRSTHVERDGSMRGLRHFRVYMVCGSGKECAMAVSHRRPAGMVIAGERMLEMASVSPAPALFWEVQCSGREQFPRSFC